MNTETQTSAADTAHTPGPWIVQHGMVWTRFDNVRDDRLSACICDPNEGSLESGALLPHAEQLANARLIAAAPDLLAALQRIYSPAIHAMLLAKEADGTATDAELRALANNHAIKKAIADATGK